MTSGGAIARIDGERNDDLLQTTRPCEKYSRPHELGGHRYEGSDEQVRLKQGDEIPRPRVREERSARVCMW